MAFAGVVFHGFIFFCRKQRCAYSFKLLEITTKFDFVGLPFAGTCCTDLEITSTIFLRDENRWKGHPFYDSDIELSGTYTYSVVHGYNGKQTAFREHSQALVYKGGKRQDMKKVYQVYK